MIEAWILIIFILLLTTPIAISEKSFTTGGVDCIQISKPHLPQKRRKKYVKTNLY